MGTKASALAIEGIRWKPAGFPLGTVLLSLAAWAMVPNGSYAVVALAVVWFPYLVLHPQAGLWFSPLLVMAACLLAPPEGFIAGWGHSPQLAYWAVAVSIAFAATSLGVARHSGKSCSRTRQGVRVPRALYAFFAISVAGAALGLARGYSVSNVGKQFLGCLLFAAYFWFALKLSPSLRDMKRVVRLVAIPALAFSLLYAVVIVPAGGMVRDTVLNTFAAGVACLLLPQILSRARDVKKKARFMSAALLAVPVLNFVKGVVAAYGICALLLYGLRSPSRRRRLLWLAGSLLIIGVLLATPLLNYVGRAVARQPVISKLIPADVQSNYSVYLRAVEVAQMLASTGAPSLLGTGLGSTLSWYDPYAKMWFTQETVDMGWVYVLLKLGVLGLGAFLWLLGGLLVRALKNVPTGVHLALVLLVCFFAVEMVASPVILYFATAPWAGMACAWLHIMNERAEGGREGSSARVDRRPIGPPSGAKLPDFGDSAECL